MKGYSMEFNKNSLRDFLDEKVILYNHPSFIERDPIQIPHIYSEKEDIEISGFLTAVISWGNRTSILNSAKRMMSFMGNSPYDFILNHRERHLKKMDGFVHRTFNTTDLITFISALRFLYQKGDGLEGVFNRHKTADSLQPAIHQLKNEFFSVPHMKRTLKHLPDPCKGSAAKRINMFLRWMVRRDQNGVDFGIWKNIPMKALYIPLDVHSGNVARKLLLLERKQHDWKAVKELTNKLIEFDKDDPIRYDYALFGLGSFEKF